MFSNEDLQTLKSWQFLEAVNRLGKVRYAAAEMCISMTEASELIKMCSSFFDISKEEELRVYGIYPVKKKFKQEIRRMYSKKRSSALGRGIDWDFDIETWVKKWADSGHAPGSPMCIGRIMDQGPYSPSNTYITSISANSMDIGVFNRIRQKQSGIAKMSAFLIG